MTPIGAASALLGKDAAQVQPLRQPRAAESLGTPPQTEPAGSRGTFSTKELGRILSALAPALGGMDQERGATFLEEVLGNLAARRAAGQDTVLMVASVPGGGAVLTFLSPGELEAALASDDRNSLGSITTDDGATCYFRDMARDVLGRREGGAAMTVRDIMAAAVADMMAEASGDKPTDKASAEKIRELSEALASGARRGAGVGPGGASVSFVALPGRAPSATGSGGSSQLLDIAI